MPASSLAAADNGGVFTSPCNQTKGLSVWLIETEYMSIMTWMQGVKPS